MQFIGLAREGGELASLHGEAEVEEDLRWACAQHLDPRGYRFVDFVACRARDRGEDGWERCVPEGLDGRAIRACAEGPLGRRLVAESFELARALGITASPSWLLNNRWPMQARTRREMLDAFCEHNALPECAAVPEIIEQGPARTPAGSCR